MTEWEACNVCKEQACVNCEECGPCYGIKCEAEEKLAAAENRYKQHLDCWGWASERIAELEELKKHYEHHAEQWKDRSEDFEAVIEKMKNDWCDDMDRLEALDKKRVDEIKRLKNGIRDAIAVANDDKRSAPARLIDVLALMESWLQPSGDGSEARCEKKVREQNIASRAAPKSPEGRRRVTPPPSNKTVSAYVSPPRECMDCEIGECNNKECYYYKSSGRI